METFDPAKARIRPRALTKGEKRKFAILEGASSVLKKKGAEALNYNVIGQEIGVSRALVAHYFPDKQDLLIQCVELLAFQSQSKTIEKLQRAKTVEDALKAYIAGAVDPAYEDAGYVSLMLLFYHYTQVSPKVHEFHEQLRSMGAERFLSTAHSMGWDYEARLDIKLVREIQMLVRSRIIENFLNPKKPSALALKKAIFQEVLSLVETPS